MRVGFVSFWFNRGQAFVTKALRSIVREAGHETCVLARPDRTQGRVRTDDVWAEDGVEVAEGNDISEAAYLAWAAKHRIEVCFLFQNEQFAEARALRRAGVKVVGTFMWEKLTPAQAAEARESYDLVYAMNACDSDRYARLGLLTMRVRWACWPELSGLEVPPRGAGAPVVFYYPAGYLESRRAIAPTVEAFLASGAADGGRARLLVKAAKPIPESMQIRHPAVAYHGEDLTRAAYLDLLRGCDVFLCNTRWEGLGLGIYESIAMGLPVIAPDFPPMSENVRHGLTGLLVPLRRRGLFGRDETAPSGIPAADADPRALAEAVARLADRATVAAMSRNQLLLRDRDYTWDRTREDVLRLLRYAAG
ncbi:MAG: hypothetical protein HMLKMBBP_02201 [Planctomycetes bacterium]|nr:hypothetical protein [Planctomycetota bacterium]